MLKKNTIVSSEKTKKAFVIFPKIFSEKTKIFPKQKSIAPPSQRGGVFFHRQKMTEKENVAVSHPTGVLEISENNFRVGSIKEFVELWEFSASYFLIKEMDLYVLRIACGMKSCKFGQNALALLRDVNGKNGRQLPFTGIGKLLRAAVNKKAFSFNENGMPTKVVNAECWGVDLDDFADVLMVMGFAVRTFFLEKI